VQAPRPLFWLDGHYRTVQDQGWKLIVSQRPKKHWLFNLNADPTERVNLASQEPQKVAQLQAMLDAHSAQMPPPLWESYLEGPIFIDKTLDQKKTAEDEYTYWVN
jgi:arylsulfatase A-like enzyme